MSGMTGFQCKRNVNLDNLGKIYWILSVSVRALQIRLPGFDRLGDQNSPPKRIRRISNNSAQTSRSPAKAWCLACYRKDSSASACFVLVQNKSIFY